MKHLQKNKIAAPFGLAMNHKDKDNDCVCIKLNFGELIKIVLYSLSSIPHPLLLLVHFTSSTSPSIIFSSSLKSIDVYGFFSKLFPETEKQGKREERDLIF